MWIELFLVIIWTIAGVMTLCLDEVPKVSYAVCWVVLMMSLINDLVEVIA